MADWYIAPDGVVKTGLVFGTIGAGGYGHSWGNAVKWSQFQTAAGCWANRGVNDVFHFLSADKEYTISNGGGWAALVWNQAGMVWQGETMDGTPSPIVIVGTRDWPWPKAGNAATYAGETVINLATAAVNPIYKMIHFRSVKYCVTTQNTGAATDFGQATFTDCVATNTFGGLITSTTQTDGRMNVVIARCRQHGFGGSTQRIWPNNSGHSVDATDFFGDSEHQNDNPSFSTAHATSLINVKDSSPQYTTVKTPATLTRVVAINCAAGHSGSGYQQGDGTIFEENTGSVKVRSLLTWGAGDRGLDSKCAGTIQHMISLGDGTAGVGHHLDTVAMLLYNCLLRAGARLTTATSPPSSAALQSSGWTKSWMTYLSTKPTATQAAFNSYGATAASIDPGKAAQGIVGAIHQGKQELYDSVEVVGTTAGATEQVGYGGSSQNGRMLHLWGLTPGTTKNYKVRAVDPTGVPGVYTADIPVTTSAAGTGDSTGPAAPTGLTATPVTGGVSCTFTWNQNAEDAGVAIQGYVMLIDFGDGLGYLPVAPAKSASPLTLSGFKPATAYSVKIAAYDANNNLGTASGAVGFTTTSGSVSASTPSVPLTVGIDFGFTVVLPNVACTLGKAGAGSTGPWDACATGVAAYYECADSGTGIVVARSMTVPTTGSAPSLTKGNTLLVTV